MIGILKEILRKKISKHSISERVTGFQATELPRKVAQPQPQFGLGNPPGSWRWRWLPKPEKEQTKRGWGVRGDS